MTRISESSPRSVSRSVARDACRDARHLTDRAAGCRATNAIAAAARPALLVAALLAQSLLATPGAAAPGDLLWWFQGVENINSMVEVGDIDGDTTPDIAVESYDAGVPAGEPNLSLLSGTTGVPIWQVRTQSGPSNSGGYEDDCLHLGDDMSGDGIPDLLLGTAWGGRSAMGIDVTSGAQLWIFDTYIDTPPSPPESGWVYTIHPVPDLTGDGIDDAIFGAGSDNNGAYAVSGADGSVIFRLYAGDAIVSSATLGDVTGDGLSEVVYGGGDFETRVFCISGASVGIANPVWETDVGDGTQYMVPFIDVDGDGLPEVLVGTWNYEVVCLSGADGSIVWTRSLGTGNVIMQLAVLDDVDFDNAADIAVGSWSNSATVLSGKTGTVIWYGLTGGDVWAVDGTEDVTGDGRSDVVAGSFDGRAYLFDGVTGDPLWSYVAGDKVMSVRGVSDLSGNGVPDVVAGTQYLSGSGGRVYALEGNDATPVEAPVVDARVARSVIEITWEADWALPGTVYNVYRREQTAAPGDVERAPEAMPGADGALALQKAAIARSGLPRHERLALALALAADDGFVRLNDAPITATGPTAGFVDATAEAGGTYAYRIGYTEPGGPERFLQEVVVTRPAGQTPSFLAIEPVGVAGAPRTLRVALPPGMRGDYSVGLFGVDGRRVRVLESGRLSGETSALEVAWDGRDQHGGRLASGIYIAEVAVSGAGRAARATSKVLWLH
ncbi:MAG: PQQ-binding-like beta-propeller repeat protein [Candidatus Eiseniibacteriota bacterium]